MNQKLLFILLILIVSNSLLSTELVSVNKDRQIYSLSKFMSFYEDKTNELKFENAVKKWENGEFFTTNKDIPSFGFTDSDYWGHFSIDVSTDKRASKLYYLQFQYALTDYIDLYEVGCDGEVNKRVAGDKYPFHQREFDHNSHVFKLFFPENCTQKTFFYKIRTESAMQIIAKIYTPEKFNQINQRANIALGAFYGSLLLALLFGILSYFYLRETSLIFYVIFAAASLLWQASISGTGYQYLWSNSPGFQEMSVPIFISLVGFSSSMFVLTFIEIKNSPIWVKLPPTILATLFVITHILSFFIPYRFSIITLAALAFLLPFVLTLVSLFALIKGFAQSKYYFLAWSLFLAGTGLLSLNKFGIVPRSFLTEQSQKIGTLATVIFLAIAILDKIKVLKSEKADEKKKSIKKLENLNIAYSRFVPKQFLSYLGKDSITEIKLGDQVKKSMTVVFSDIRSFTSIAEKLPPDKLFNFLNDYFSRGTPVIRKRNGFVDKFIGDSVMALFPTSSEDALCAIVEIERRNNRINKLLIKNGQEPVKTGYGIHYGDLILGTIGEDERMESTVISDSVNVASRLEGLTKLFGVSIIISEIAFNRISNKSLFKYRFIGRVNVRGKKESISIFEIFNNNSPEMIKSKESTKNSFYEGISLLHKEELEKAFDIFRNMKEKNPEDTVAHYYCNYTEALLLKDDSKFKPRKAFR